VGSAERNTGVPHFDSKFQFIEVASVEMTMPEIAIALSQVLGKPVNYQQIPFEAFEQQVGEELTIMYRWFENVGYTADFPQLQRDFSAPTDFESYLRDRNWTELSASSR
jgi:hypothetical protein